jgi:tRNA A-37 threonylcarbamoyl transferase component Bud32
VETSCPACGVQVLDIDPHCPSCNEPLTSDEARRRIGSTVLEHYAITDVLGQGGMSVVYRARHRLTDQEVALKILPPDLAAHNQVKTRFLEEARALAQLDHPNIVHLYNFGQDDGCLVLAMQLVAGSTWERLILTRGMLDWQTSCAIAIDVLKALELAHGRGVIHRDMKPSNVLVRSDGSALVMDFGIAKMTTSTRLTATGQTMGTVRYMSPEQVRGQEVDGRTDLYSLAVTLYESLCGVTPFDGDSHFEIMTAHLTASPPPLAERGVSVPPELEKLVMDGLAKSPDRRPSSARQMRALLEEITSSSGGKRPIDQSSLSAAGPEAGRRLDRRPRTWIALAGAGVLVAAVAVFAVMRFGRADRNRSSPPAGADAPTAEWPAPHRLEGESFRVDTRFPSDRLHVLSVAARDAEQVRSTVGRIRRDFTAFLSGRGVNGIEPPALNLVIVPQRRMCEAQIYESGAAPAGCESKHYWYRPREKTVYLADDDSMFEGTLALAVAAGICLHSAVPGCDVHVVPFAEAALDR